MVEDNITAKREAVPSEWLKVDSRYALYPSFLVKQLRTAPAVTEFRSVRSALSRSKAFSVARRTFQFATVPIER